MGPDEALWRGRVQSDSLWEELAAVARKSPLRAPTNPYDRNSGENSGPISRQVGPGSTPVSSQALSSSRLIFLLCLLSLLDKSASFSVALACAIRLLPRHRVHDLSVDPDPFRESDLARLRGSPQRRIEQS